jgi:hypothetical protein
MAAIGEVFVRPPNHLNIMLTDVAKFVPFTDQRVYEDFSWSVRLCKHRFFDKEYRSDPSRIHYVYNLGDREILPLHIDWQQTHDIESMAYGYYRKEDPAPQQERAMRTNGMRLTARGFVSK